MATWASNADRDCFGHLGVRCNGLVAQLAGKDCNGKGKVHWTWIPLMISQRRLDKASVQRLGDGSMCWSVEEVSTLILNFITKSNIQVPEWATESVYIVGDEREECGAGDKLGRGREDLRVVGRWGRVVSGREVWSERGHEEEGIDGKIGIIRQKV